MYITLAGYGFVWVEVKELLCSLYTKDSPACSVLSVLDKTKIVKCGFFPRKAWLHRQREYVPQHYTITVTRSLKAEIVLFCIGSNINIFKF